MLWKSSDAGPCTCQWLERAAAEPHFPIEFNETVREYHLLCEPGGPVHVHIRYCPFCGGKAPESARSSLFAHVPDAEFARLSDLTREINSIADALRILRLPDQDQPHGFGSRSPDKHDEPVIAENFRTLVYSNLSDTVDVTVVEYPDRVRVLYQAKYTGPNGDPEPQSAA